MMYVQSLTIEICFHLHLLEVESFSVPIKNQILDFCSGPTNIAFSQIVLKSILVQCATYAIVILKPKAPHTALTLRIDFTVI